MVKCYLCTGRARAKVLLNFEVQRQTDLVEDVVAPLAWQLVHHSGLLQKICLDACPTDAPTVIEKDVDELAKAATVVVPQRLCIAKGLQKGVGLQDLVLHPCTHPSPAQLRLSLWQARQLQPRAEGHSGQ